MERDHNQTPDPQYVRGFNQGYLLAQTIPALAETLSALDIEHPAIRGIHDGNTLYRLEQTRDRHLDKTHIRAEKASMNHSDPWIKSYNHGHLIARHIPELIPSLLSIQVPDASREFDGMKVGIRHVIEDMVNHLKPDLLQEREDGKERDTLNPRKSKFVDMPKDKGKDKDHDRDR